MLVRTKLQQPQPQCYRSMGFFKSLMRIVWRKSLKLWHFTDVCRGQGGVPHHTNFYNILPLRRAGIDMFVLLYQIALNNSLACFRHSELRREVRELPHPQTCTQSLFVLRLGVLLTTCRKELGKTRRSGYTNRPFTKLYPESKFLPVPKPQLATILMKGQWPSPHLDRDEWRPL